MKITVKKNKKRGDENIFIFEFNSKDDMDAWLGSLREQAEHLRDEFTRDHMLDTLDTLISRTDNKYAREGCEYSGMLFPSEISGLLMDLIVAGDQFYGDWFVSEFGIPGNEANKKDVEPELDYEDDIEMDY